MSEYISNLKQLVNENYSPMSIPKNNTEKIFKDINKNKISIKDAH